MIEILCSDPAEHVL